MTELAEFIARHDDILVLTGAGISAASGIPTYRNQAGEWQRSQPIQHQAFIDHPASRQRYWARSAVGWNSVGRAVPNDAHRALVTLESQGKVSTLITQNVDRLHQRAGHQNVIDLHGRLDKVICLSCANDFERGHLQQRLLALNPQLEQAVAALAPDGDAEVEEHLVDNINCPPCEHCQGVLMPDVVFFGGSVPKPRLQQAMDALAQADALLVVGSSLMVYSGFRFCKKALEQQKPICAINQGKTRADDIISLKINKDCSIALRDCL